MNATVRRVLRSIRYGPRTIRAASMGIRFVPPNYAFKVRFSDDDVAIDIGPGENPDFSKCLIGDYGVRCFAVDPTRKHAAGLRAFAEKESRFRYLPLAVGPVNGQDLFYESMDLQSGTLIPGHRNMSQSEYITYEVNTVTFAELLRLVGSPRVSIVKMDIEGAEYKVIDSMDISVLNDIDQLLIEFHHDWVAGFTRLDSAKAVTKLRKAGFKAWAYDGRNCLLYR